MGLLTLSNLLIFVAILSVAGFFAGRARAVSSCGGQTQVLHSLPRQHGWHVALAAFVPAVVFVILWNIGAAIATNAYVNANIPDDQPEIQLPLDVAASLSPEEVETRINGQRDLFAGNVKGLAAAIDAAIAAGQLSQADVAAWRADFAPLQDRLRAQGAVIATQITQGMLDDALAMRAFKSTASVMGLVSAAVIALVGFGLALWQINPAFRARKYVEGWIVGFLGFASSVAILTTIAILASITLPTLAFFKEYGLFNFLFGLTWGPAGDVAGVPAGPDGTYKSALGFLPLIWGTLYIALVALLVAVPLGLTAAIYLSEFATQRVRTLVKPSLEILAGIPTIVYGIFALLTVGPFLQAVVGATIMPNTVSIMTAGVVMGMMLVPFVSSLSDDVINAVPQSLRDGSLGLGATPAETVTQVILPAALPGIVGAIVLAASRAIGETMIVVLAAGALSSVTGLEPNPFGAVVTVTTRIVAILTGEGSGFDSIDVLAVFALAFTLFFVTLALNLLAQRIVAKYREQYD